MSKKKKSSRSGRQRAIKNRSQIVRYRALRALGALTVRLSWGSAALHPRLYAYGRSAD